MDGRRLSGKTANTCAKEASNDYRIPAAVRQKRQQKPLHAAAPASAPSRRRLIAAACIERRFFCRAMPPRRSLLRVRHRFIISTGSVPHP